MCPNVLTLQHTILAKAADTLVESTGAYHNLLSHSSGSIRLQAA